ncbi:MAG: hypothetical protein ABWZ83_00815 [Mesorhizobium sp.]
MTKLNAMEGIHQSADSRAMFAAFDQKGASPAARHNKMAWPSWCTRPSPTRTAIPRPQF